MNLFNQSKKWLLLFFCFFFSFSALAQGAESTFRFSPDWQEGEQADYDFTYDYKVSIAEFPLFSGSWLNMNGDIQYQILGKTKNEITLKNQMQNVSVSSPKFSLVDSSLPASSPAKGFSKTLPQDLSTLLSSFQIEYDINKKGQIVRYNNLEDFEFFIDQYFDLLTKYVGPNVLPIEMKESVLAALKEEIKEPQDGSGIHAPLFYEKKIKIGKVQDHPYTIKIPAAKSKGQKAFSFSLPGNYEAIEEDSKVTIYETYHLNNEDSYKLLTEMIESSSSKKEAEAFIKNWETLKGMGVTANSTMTLKNIYELPKEGKWPLKIQTALQWNLNADIKSLKTLGLKELQNYPDTLHIKMEFAADQNLKQETDTAIPNSNKGDK